MIYNITPFSTLDYPDHLSAIIWFAGCNMRCEYCYNGDIVFSKGSKTVDEALIFLKKRVGMLEAVVLSGGEATGFEGLVSFAKEVKALGYKIKLDTNGTHPEVIKELLDNNLLDYIALDYKAPLQKFYEITKNKNFHLFEESLVLLIKEEIDFEVRTTLHNDLLNVEDINLIMKDLKIKGYTKMYYIQNFVEDVETIGGVQNPKRSFDKSKLSSDLEVIWR